MKRIDETTRTSVRQAIEEGCSYRAVAKRFRVALSTVWRWMKGK